MENNDEIKASYNYVIDPEYKGTARLVDANGTEVPITTTTHNGKTLVIKPTTNLESSKTYTLTVSGVKDLLGQTANEITTNFTTGRAIYMSDITLNNGQGLIDGVNTAKFSLTSNDGHDYSVTLIAAIYDNNTNSYSSKILHII